MLGVGDSFHVKGSSRTPTGLRPHEFSNTSHGDFVGKVSFKKGGGNHFSARPMLVEKAYGKKNMVFQV